MKEITINEIQLIKAGAIISVSEMMLQAYRQQEQEAADIEEQIVYQELIRSEELRLEMTYSLLSAMGLSYDADTYEITQKGEEEDV